jgi:glycosyltransferase involved in cell wall biosynthesis
VFAPTAFTASCLQGAYRGLAEKLTVVPVGVSDRFAPQVEPGEREALQSGHGLPASGYLFYPANPWPHKNHRRLFEAVRLASQRLGFALPVVCTGRLPGEQPSLGAAAEAAGLAPGQLFDLGFVAEDELPALYRSARLLAFPSLFEGFGLPLVEAMACGCPVASSSAACLPEVSAGAARLFDPLDPEAMAEALVEVWEEGPLRRGLVERGLVRADGLRWPRVLPDLLRAYRMAGSS